MLVVNILFWLFNQEQWQTCSRLLEMLQCPQGTAVMTRLKSHSEGGRCHVALLYYLPEFLLHPQEGPTPSNTLPLPVLFLLGCQMSISPSTVPSCLLHIISLNSHYALPKVILLVNGKWAFKSGPCKSQRDRETLL